MGKIKITEPFTAWRMKPGEIGECCLICGSPYAQHHHIFHGTSRRSFADKYGYVIPLCQEHHTGKQGIHFNRGLDLYWMQKAQRHFETYYGTREDFIRECGKSYL